MWLPYIEVGPWAFLSSIGDYERLHACQLALVTCDWNKRLAHSRTGSPGTDVGQSGVDKGPFSPAIQCDHRWSGGSAKLRPSATSPWVYSLTHFRVYVTVIVFGGKVAAFNTAICESGNFQLHFYSFIHSMCTYCLEKLSYSVGAARTWIAWYWFMTK